MNERRFCNQPSRQLISALLLSALTCPSVFAQQSNTASPTPLQGGLQESGRLNPYIKIQPNAASLSAGTSQVQQFAGRGTYSPGQPAPIPPPAPKKPPPPPASLAAGATVPKVVPPAPPKPPPKWDYTATPKSGIMTWEPGHSTNVLKPAARPGTPVPRNPMRPGESAAATRPGGMDWREILQRRGLRPEQFAQLGLNGRLNMPNRRYAPQVVPMMATAGVLSSAASAPMSQPASWDEWYGRVSKAIYDQWNRASTGPGTARLRVTVFRSNDVDCQIVDFYPAPDVERNAQDETTFRETAIRAVYNLRKCQILCFPFSASKTKVCFDMDMKRAVNGPAGCDIAAIHDEPAKAGAAR